MKRFEASVENMLIGKYGIAWNSLREEYNGYYRTCKDGIVTEQEFWPDYVYFTPSLIELYGIFAFEYDRSPIGFGEDGGGVKLLYIFSITNLLSQLNKHHIKFPILFQVQLHTTKYLLILQYFLFAK